MITNLDYIPQIGRKWIVWSTEKVVCRVNWMGGKERRGRKKCLGWMIGL